MGIKCYLSSEYFWLGDNDVRAKYYQLRTAFPRLCPQRNKRNIESDDETECQKIKDCLVPVHRKCKVLVYGPGKSTADQKSNMVPASLNRAKLTSFNDEIFESFAKPTEGEVELTKTKSCDFSQSGFDDLVNVIRKPGVPKHIAIAYDWKEDPQNTAMIPQRFSLDLSNAKDIKSVNLNIWEGSGIEIELILPESAASLVEL